MVINSHLYNSRVKLFRWDERRTSSATVLGLENSVVLPLQTDPTQFCLFVCWVVGLFVCLFVCLFFLVWKAPNFVQIGYFRRMVENGKISTFGYFLKNNSIFKTNNFPTDRPNFSEIPILLGFFLVLWECKDEPNMSFFMLNLTFKIVFFFMGIQYWDRNSHVIGW